MKRAACAVTAMSLGALSALGLWSWWWPHRDVRQLWATAGMAIAVAAFAVSVHPCRSAHPDSSVRTTLIRLASGALISGAALLTWLIAITAAHR